MAGARLNPIIEIQAIGFKEAEARMRLIRVRMTHLQPVWAVVERLLEHGEERVFERAHGKYVLTGATKESLTQSDGRGAIREAHASELTFGTSVWYARFLRKGPKGTPAYKKSAVLVLMPKERKEIREVVMDYIMGSEIPAPSF